MEPMNAIVIFVFTALAALGGTLLVERYSGALGLVKPPNERSSHSRPTPRGGGLAVAAAIILAIGFLALSGLGALWPAVAATFFIAVLGFSDDLVDLKASLRFPIQAIVIVLLVVGTGTLPAMQIGALHLTSWALLAVVVFLGLWWVNLYNFMDGIDGIAASHAVLVLAQALWLGHQATSSVTSEWHWLSLVGIAASCGFLCRNWPPARIFMGDAGSNALAIVILATALTTISAGVLTYPSWAILVAVFVADATVTLVRRALRGEKPWRAHRRHAYQQVSRLIGHKATTTIYCVLSVLWTFPLALWAIKWSEGAWYIAALAYLPLVVAAGLVGGGSASETTIRPETP